MSKDIRYFESDGPSNCCGTCGAGMHNNYQHDPNCLINVALKDMPHWRAGWARPRQERSHRLSNDAYSAFAMGSAMRDKVDVGAQPLELTAHEVHALA